MIKYDVAIELEKIRAQLSDVFRRLNQLENTTPVRRTPEEILFNAKKYVDDQIASIDSLFSYRRYSSESELAIMVLQAKRTYLNRLKKVLEEG